MKSYRIGCPVTYAKAPKQNEIIRLTLEAIPTSWQVKKNPSLHIEKAVIALKLHELPPQDDIQKVQSTIYDTTGLYVRGTGVSAKIMYR